MGESGDKILGGLGVLFGDHALVFHGRLPILLAFLLVSALARHRTENSRRRQDLVKVLELLPGALFVAVADGSVVDFFDVGEAVHDKGAKEDRV